MHTDEFANDASLSLECFNLSSVRVFEVVGSKIHPGALRHQVNYNLDESLLLESITSVLIALHVLKSELHLGLLVFVFPVKNIFENGKTINIWKHVPQITILHRLSLVDIERYDFKHLLLDSPHILETAVVHQIELMIVSHNIVVISFT